MARLAMVVALGLVWLGAQTLPGLSAAAMAAPATSGVGATDAMEMFGSATTADPVGAGDLLDVRVFGQPQLSGDLRVGPDGAIAPPFIPRVMVGGETPSAIQSDLQKAYASLLVHPLVSVRVLENNSRKIAINGAVARPGVYTMSGDLTLMQALALAGGVDPVKASQKVLLFRAPPPSRRVDVNGHSTFTVNETLETIDLAKLPADPSLNQVLQPGDVIEVPEAHQVYIAGDVMHPGAEPLTPGLTLTQLVGEAGGFLPQANGSHVRVLRLRGSQRQVLEVNVRAAQKDQAPDLTLEPDDLVQVSGSPLRMAGLELLDFFTGTGRWRVQQSVANHIP